MTKINKKEYEILKNLDEKWKWIAKDDNYGGFIFCFREKPHKDIRKGGWSPDTTQYKCLWEYDVLFQFIQWEDEEPYNIAELIEDYESEETEVKKDISEEELDGLINKLDKPEVLSSDWIESNSVYASSDGVTEEYIHVDDLKELLVPKTVSKKPTIPEFVADFLDGKEDYALYELLDNDSMYDSHDRLAKWLYDNDEKTNRERELSLVLAHIYSYEMETEQKYYVVNNDQRMMLVRMMDGKTITEADPFKLEDMYEGEKESHRLTEQEIKGYDPRYWAFRKPVEELEKWK